MDVLIKIGQNSLVINLVVSASTVKSLSVVPASFPCPGLVYGTKCLTI